jgi:hypothetical protein
MGPTLYFSFFIFIFIYTRVCVCVQQVNKIYTSEQNPNVLVTKSDLRYAINSRSLSPFYRSLSALYWVSFGSDA